MTRSALAQATLDAHARAVAEAVAAERERWRKEIRAIELRIDALNIKGFTPRPREKAALNDIKARCRAALED